MSLFNKKTIARAIAQAGTPDPIRFAAFAKWAESIASGRIAELKETELHDSFMHTITIDGLGYRGLVGVGSYSVTQEKAIIQGSVDLAAVNPLGVPGREIGTISVAEHVSVSSA